MKATRDSAEFQRLVRVWMDLGYSRRQAGVEAREELRVAAVWSKQGMIQGPSTNLQVARWKIWTW